MEPRRRTRCLCNGLLLALLAIARPGPARAELVVEGMPKTFQPNPSSPCAEIKATFMISFTEKEKDIQKEAIDNGNKIQDFTIAFLGKDMKPDTIASTDGIITSVELKPIKGAAIKFTVEDDRKTKANFKFTIAGPNKWLITTVPGKLTEFITMVTATGFLQVPGDKTIILGETIQPSGGPKLSAQGQVTGNIAEPAVAITHPSRSNDRVVSAKDQAKGMRGGTKVIHVDTKGATVDLTIERMVGQTGSATFVEKSTARKGVFDITIKGGEISDRARNMTVMATDTTTKKMLGCFTFTVFRVDQEAFMKGDAADVGGFKQAADADNILLLNTFKGNQGSTLLGVNPPNMVRGEQIAYGGIVFRGRVVPKDMDKDDFDRLHNRFESFFWQRRLSGRRYDGNGCVFKSNNKTDLRLNSVDDFTDSHTDVDKDLTPDPDDPTQRRELFIWSFDAPTLTAQEATGAGDTASVRYQFNGQQVFYSSAEASAAIAWFFRASIKRNKNKIGLISTSKDPKLEDNEVNTGATPISFDLVPSKFNFGIQNVVPVAITLPKAPTIRKQVPGQVTGNNLNAAKACQTVVYMAIEIPKEDETVFDLVQLEIVKNGIQNATIKGEYTVLVATEPSTNKQNYVVKVLLYDKAQTANPQVTITKPK